MGVVPPGPKQFFGDRWVECAYCGRRGARGDACLSCGATIEAFPDVKPSDFPWHPKPTRFDWKRVLADPIVWWAGIGLGVNLLQQLGLIDPFF